MPIENIVFDRVQLTARNGATCTNARNITFRQTKVLPENGEPYTLVNTEAVTITD